MSRHFSSSIDTQGNSAESRTGAFGTAAAYCAAKAALAALIEALRVDLAPRGIIVTLLMPGLVHTNPGKKRKPLALSLDAATERMARAIDRRRPYDAFPWTLHLPLVLLRLAPAAVADRLLRIGRRHADKRAPAASRASDR